MLIADWPPRVHFVLLEGLRPSSPPRKGWENVHTQTPVCLRFSLREECVRVVACQELTVHTTTLFENYVGWRQAKRQAAKGITAQNRNILLPLSMLLYQRVEC